METHEESNGKTQVAIATTTVTAKTPIYKVVVAGEGGVGKTSIIQRYITGFSSTPIMTVGSEFAYQELDINTQRVGLSIWDFGGEERFRELMPIFCLGAHGAFVVFDLTRFSTFLQLAYWIKIIRDAVGTIPLILVGAKADLKGGPSDEDLHEFCLSHEVSAYFPVSARTGDNIRQLFSYLADKMLQATDEGLITPAYSLKD